MPDVTLHFKAQITSRECAVCGTRLDRSDRDHWWLRNTWTTAVQDYHEGGGCMPTDWFRPCGRLPAEYGKTPNVAGNRLARQGQSELTGVLGLNQPEREDG